MSYPGLGIQCEQCHGTGQSDAVNGHTNTDVVISGDLAVLGQSQVCGQCHGSYTNLSTARWASTATPPTSQMRDFVDVNGVSGGQSYTKIPTEAEFALAPTTYWMYPNGSNAKGNHYYYDEWAASAHSYRAAYSSATPRGDGVSRHRARASTPTTCSAPTPSPPAATSATPARATCRPRATRSPRTSSPTQTNVGKMGQECITCHNGHPDRGRRATTSSVEPDQAGERSAKGLTVSNQSICEDCHNWQMEVLGTTPNPMPMADLSAHGGASHPQRENLHARSVMYDVADGSEYMPGAKCEDCHMPKTNKAETRISHGMKPMLPGDAEKWQAEAKYTAGQDSCSACHPSRTRDELQANIDEWQSDC